MKHDMHLTIIMPALNEVENIRDAVGETLRAFDECGIDGDVLVINDGSTDGTQAVVEEIMQTDKRVSVRVHDAPWGVGASFWDGQDHAKGDVICFLPGDNENDPWEIFQYFRLLEHVDIVIPFVFNRQVRPFLRNALSFMYRFIVNSTFLVNFNYTNGTIMWRRSILHEIGSKLRSTGFFFQTDALIRLTRKGYLFAEVPIRLGQRGTGVSKALSFPSFMNVVRGYLKLVRDVYVPWYRASKSRFQKDSAAQRRQSDGMLETGERP